MIHLKSAREVETIRASCRIAAETIARVGEAVAVGATTQTLDEVADAYIRKQGAVASAKGYKGYPKSICVSVNDEIVHGIPGEKVLCEGDILAVDIAVKKNGYHGDMNVTFVLGKVDDSVQHLVDTTREAMELGLLNCAPGNRLGDVGSAIQVPVEAAGYSIVREYCGHGIGREFHEEPQLLHFGMPGTGRRLQAGMVFTVEPMVNQGGPEVRVLDDDWTALTADGSLSVQFEHTVAVTGNGPDILSRFDDLPY
jgi:methionyl aminopeptidase